MADEGGALARLQRRVADGPQNASAWAALGAAYVEQARTTLDPTYYTKAEEALRRSLDLDPSGNLAASIGMGTLANSRHDFAGGLTWGLKARGISAYSPEGQAVLADAYTQLGRPAAATRAIQAMLDLNPALPALARASYDREQRGDVRGARALMQRALADSYTGADIGFCRYHLGELARTGGDLQEASRHYQRGLAADPQSFPLLQGAAKIAALRGDTATALRGYTELVARAPNPHYRLEYGELLAKLGRTEQAEQQFTLVATERRAAVVAGGFENLSLAEYEADHGSATEAVRHARIEWDRRRSPIAADALAWALHRAGRSHQALPYADRALAGGWRNALFLHHRAEIHHAMGDQTAARADTARMREADPSFNPALPAFARSA